MATPTQEPAATVRMRRRLFDVDEYYRMAEAGILRPDERVELLDGVIYTMHPHGYRLFDVDEYYRMAEVGILRPDERVELIAGEITEMSPIGDRHAGYVIRLDRLLSKLVGDRALVSVQNPVRLERRSEPQPDVVLLRPRSDDYIGGKPTPADVLLMIEVSDTTLQVDRQVKVPEYARTGVPEVWILNVRAKIVEVYTQPGEKGYATRKHFRRGEFLEFSALPGLMLPVDDIFAE